MDVLPYLALGLLAVVLLVTLRPLQPQLATLLSVGAGLLLLAVALGRLRPVIQTLNEMAARAELDPLFLRTALKVVGVAYLAGFAAQVCRDAGEGTMAGKMELVGKVAILLLALPVMWAVLNTMLRLF
ncbi:MAG: stage III sporulation protein AD [Bacteroidota bacterium]